MKLKKTIGAAAVTAGAGALLLPLIGPFAAPASAAPATVSWDDGSSHYDRTISDTTPAIGDTITVTTQFQRKDIDEYIYKIKDISDQCLDYVAGSAKWEGGAISAVNTSKPGEVLVSSPDSISWRVATAGLVWNWGAKRSFSLQYKVTPECSGKSVVTTMHYGGSRGDGTYQGKGPTITVAKIVKANSSTSVSVNPSPRANVASTVTARVSATGKTPTGTVDFFNNGTKIGSGTVSNGAASTSWTPSAAGAYAIKAVYSGDAYLNESSSEVDSGTVAGAPGADDPANATDLDLSHTATVAPGTKVKVSGKAGARTTSVVVRVGGVEQKCSPLTVTAGGAFSCEITTTSAMDGQSVTVTPHNGSNAGAVQTVGRLSVESDGGPVDPGGPGDPGDGNDGGGNGGSLDKIFGS